MLGQLSHQHSLALGVTAFSLLAVVGLGLAAVAAWERRSADAETPTLLSHRARSVLVLLVVGLFVMVATIGAATGAYAVALPPLVFLLWAIRRPVENVACGVALALTRPFEVGDWIVWEGHAGEVASIALTHVRVRTRDRSLLQIPHRAILSVTLVNVSADAVDAPIETVLPVPAHLEPTRARELAIVCAATSPYASLRRRPETYVDVRTDATISLRVRGYVNDARHGETYRSHIVEAWHECTAAPPA